MLIFVRYVGHESSQSRNFRLRIVSLRRTADGLRALSVGTTSVVRHYDPSATPSTCVTMATNAMATNTSTEYSKEPSSILTKSLSAFISWRRINHHRYSVRCKTDRAARFVSDNSKPEVDSHLFRSVVDERKLCRRRRRFDTLRGAVIGSGRSGIVGRFFRRTLPFSTPQRPLDAALESFHRCR